MTQLAKKIKLSGNNIDKLFNYYYSQGNSRSLVAMSNVLGIPYNDLYDTAEAYGWEQKIVAKDMESQKGVQKKYLDEILTIRQRLVSQVTSLLSQMESSSLGLPFTIESANDFRSLAQAYECLVRANNMAMMGAKETAEDEVGTATTWHDLLEKVSSDV